MVEMRAESGYKRETVSVAVSPAPSRTAVHVALFTFPRWLACTSCSARAKEMAKNGAALPRVVTSVCSEPRGAMIVAETSVSPKWTVTPVETPCRVSRVASI